MAERKYTTYEQPRSIAEEKITAFCSGCDNFKGESIPCAVVGSNDQSRYAARKHCGWATVDGKRTEIKKYEPLKIIY